MRTLLLTLIIATTQQALTSVVEPTLNQITVSVKGMVCAFCAQGIEKNFKAQQEVNGIEVSLEKKYVKITFKDGQKLTNEKIAKILEESGYEAVFGE